MLKKTLLIVIPALMIVLWGVEAAIISAREPRRWVIVLVWFLFFAVAGLVGLLIYLACIKL
mgnify:CR=1 FL=1